MTGPGDAASSDTRPRAPQVAVRQARFRDVPALVRLYRGQSHRSRQFFHPYPFDRPRLILVFGLMVVSQRIVRTMLRVAPNYAFVVLVAQGPGEPLAGFGAIRMVRRQRAPPWAQFGFMVAEGRQGRGIGTKIARAMYETAVGLGVRTGGGTMLVDNGPSRALAERFGFRLSLSPEVDPLVPDRQVLRSRTDLSEVLAHGPAPEATLTPAARDLGPPPSEEGPAPGVRESDPG